MAPMAPSSAPDCLASGNVVHEAEDYAVVGVEGFDANRVGLVPDDQRHSAVPCSLPGAHPLFGS